MVPAALRGKALEPHTDGGRCPTTGLRLYEPWALDADAVVAGAVRYDARWGCEAGKLEEIG